MAFPSKLYLEKNLFEANEMQTYADLDKFKAVKVNCSNSHWHLVLFRWRVKAAR